MIRFDYARDEAGHKGYFSRSAEGWAEHKNERLYSRFQETARGEEYVELFSPERAMWVRLTSDKCYFTRDRAGQWIYLFSGKMTNE
jgi:hypothetical protein